jgi:hypothetical protein
MNPIAEMVFLHEIVLQSNIAQKAADRLPINPAGFDDIEVWCSIQSILVSAGNVSKILWPHNKKRKDRGVRLRKLLNVDNNNILKDRKFRNHFEHYDDRIEDWFNEQSSSVYSDLAFTPFKSIWGNIPENHHRAYNAVDRIVTFRGESLNLNEVLKALEEIRLKCKPFILM